MRYRIKEKIYGENIKKYKIQKFCIFRWKTVKYVDEKETIFDDDPILITKRAIFNTKEEAEHFLLDITDDHIYLDSNINIYKTY